MAKTKARASKGTKLYMSNMASSPTWSLVGDVKSIGGPNRDTDFLDATHLNSPSNYREEIPNYKTSGEVPVGLQWTPDDDASIQRDVEEAYDSQALIDWAIVWPKEDGTSGRSDTFSAYVKAFANSADTGSVLMASCVLKIKGEVDIDDATFTEPA